MKRLATILLLSLLLFNWLGYRLFTACLEKNANAQLEAQLDKNDYDEAQLISIKVPVTHLSYYNSSNSFERVDGQTEVNGVIYKYVKRRLYNDSLEMLCIPNNTVMQLHSAKDDFFKLVNDLQYSSQGKKQNTQNNISKIFSLGDYNINDSQQQDIPGFPVFKKYFHYTENTFLSFFTTEEQPPDILA